MLLVLTCGGKVNAVNKVPTDRPIVGVYIRPGYKAKLRQLAAIKSPRHPSMSDTAAELIENAINQLIENGTLTPILEEEVQSDLEPPKKRSHPATD
jgi:hypothetical protein